MGFLVIDNAGLQAIGDTSTTQNHPLGMRVRAYDKNYLASQMSVASYTTATITGTAPNMGLTDTAGAFTKDLVGCKIVFGGTQTTAANLGSFEIVGVLDATHLLFTNANGVAEAMGASGTCIIPVSRGFGEFVYAKGVASTVAGDACILYADGTTQRTVHTTYAIGRLGIAMSANVASQYGWYQVEGTAFCTQSATAIGTANSAVYLTSTAGTLDDSVVKGDQVVGANWGASVRTTIQLLNPFCGTADAQS